MSVAYNSCNYLAGKLSLLVLRGPSRSSTQATCFGALRAATAWNIPLGEIAFCDVRLKVQRHRGAGE
jgi:hypothetical protein